MLQFKEMAIRRKNFYERNQFVEWSHEYEQLPYRKEEEALPVMICCYGPLREERDFEMVKRTLYTEVYGRTL